MPSIDDLNRADEAALSLDLAARNCADPAALGRATWAATAPLSRDELAGLVDCLAVLLWRAHRRDER